MDIVVLIMYAAIIGLIAGFVGGLLGLGGGVVIVPGLLILLGPDEFHVAKMVSLIAIVFKSAVGAHEHRKLGNLNRDMGIKLGILGVVGAAIGVFVSMVLDVRILVIIFAVILFISAARFFQKAHEEEKKVEGKWAIPLIGLGGGFLAGLLGIGGGVILVQGMVYIGVTMHTAVGTSLLAIVFNGASGAAIQSYLYPGSINWAIIIPATITNIIGVIWGARYCDKCDAPKVKKYFGVALVLIGLYLILEASGLIAFR